MPKPIGTRAQLHRLEELISRSECSLDDLRELADPDPLALLFEIELRTLLRTPRSHTSTAPTPARLLATAQRAAAAGLLPLATPTALRTFLDRLQSRLREAGAWAHDHPVDWQPLPKPTDLEQQWNLLSTSTDRLPPPDRLVNTFADTCWLALPELLDKTACRDLHRQLEAAHRQGVLPLERAGVGAGERVSASRSDAVLYLTGREPELLSAAPTAAAWIQWCLAHLGDRLTAALPARAIFPPAKAMLARYPAPSVGYHPHLDNPGGDHDNGRTLTLVLYLNSPEEPCNGGEITLWNVGQPTSNPPTEVFPAQGGSAVLFDSRAIPHQVRPLHPGPARWALTLWFNDTPQQAPAPPLPSLTLADVLLPIPAPHLPPATVLFHELDDATPAGNITVRHTPQTKPRVGIVSTVYCASHALATWCHHHLTLGVDHLVLIFDHLDEPAEAELAGRLAERFPASRLTVWAGSMVAKDHWPNLDESLLLALENVARSGSSNHAIAARQALNASAVLEAARGDAFGGAPLDWLLHLDADELFVLEGAGRGGATLSEHFAAASHAGLSCLRYVNHELLHQPGTKTRFKLNPRVAASKLGAVGWSKLAEYLKMAQTDQRPYFTGYFNGKSAVAVDAAAGAAGVHGWSLKTPDGSCCFLAGPCVLHFHLASRAAFRAKYLAVSAASNPPGPLLFEPSPLETSTREEILTLQQAGADPETLAQRLDHLHARMTTFSDTEIELLDEAGLILSPNLERALPSADDDLSPAPHHRPAPLGSR